MKKPVVFVCDLCGAQAAHDKSTGRPPGWGMMLRHVLSSDPKEAAKNETNVEAINDICPICIGSRWPSDNSGNATDLLRGIAKALNDGRACLDDQARRGFDLRHRCNAYDFPPCPACDLVPLLDKANVLLGNPK